MQVVALADRCAALEAFVSQQQPPSLSAPSSASPTTSGTATLLSTATNASPTTSGTASSVSAPSSVSPMTSGTATPLSAALSASPTTSGSAFLIQPHRATGFETAQGLASLGA